VNDLPVPQVGHLWLGWCAPLVNLFTSKVGLRPGYM